MDKRPKIERIHPKDLAALWAELGGVTAQIGPYVSRMRDAVRARDEKAFKSVFKDPFFKDNRKAILYLAYVGLIDELCSDEASVKKIHESASSQFRTKSSSHFNLKLPQHIFPLLDFSTPFLWDAFVFRYMKRVQGRAAASMMKYLLRVFASNIHFGVTTSSMRVEKPQTVQESVLQFRESLERGINTMLFVVSSICEALDALSHQSLIQIFGDCSSAELVEKKKRAALSSVWHFMPFALSNVAFFTELIQKGTFFVERRTTKHGEHEVVVTTKEVKDLETNLRTTEKPSQSPVSPGVIKWRSNVEFVGCPAVYSPLFLDLARSLCESHYKKQTS